MPSNHASSSFLLLNIFTHFSDAPIWLVKLFYAKDVNFDFSSFLMSLAIPKIPTPKYFTTSYFSIIKSLYPRKDVIFYYGYEWKKGSNLKL